jgi:hypothetical protein
VLLLYDDGVKFSIVLNTPYLSGTYRVPAVKPKRTRPLGTPKHREEENIKMDLQEI